MSLTKSLTHKDPSNLSPFPILASTASNVYAEDGLTDQLQIELAQIQHDSVLRVFNEKIFPAQFALLFSLL